jgi:glutamate 5-kinase
VAERAGVAAARSIVIKLGSAVLTGGADHLDRAFVHDFAAEAARLADQGRRVVLVSSGAVAAGLTPCGLATRPSDLADLQAAAAAGQPLLMSLWREAFAVRGRAVAQVLVGRSDFDARDRFLNIRNCITSLHERGIVPIVNENDAVATEEISLGDNDVLAAKLASAVRAEALLLLTTAPGVLDHASRVIPEAASHAELERFVTEGRTTQGRGGMRTKLEAARLAGVAGASTVIASGRPPGALHEIIAGRVVGTCIRAGAATHAGRRVWIALATTPVGDVRVDRGAADALRNRGASLLAKGVTGVDGSFAVGDCVRIVDEHGNAIGRGLTNLSADELDRVRGRASSELADILGRRAHDEVIHRDNMVIETA